MPSKLREFSDENEADINCSLKLVSSDKEVLLSYLMGLSLSLINYNTQKTRMQYICFYIIK